jgi:hypothetical protein
MAVSTRTGAFALGILALALTVTGVALAATDSNPSGVAKDPLVLNGYPPKSADILVNISTGQSYSVQANVTFNFVSNRVEATVQVPLVFSGVNADVRMVNNHLYASSANLTSVIGANWLSTKLSLPALYGYSLELVKPDIALIAGFGHESITKSGYSTTFVFSRDNVAVSALGAKGKLPSVGSIVWSITTGRQGEVSASTITISNKSSMTKISATVLSYNKPAHIDAPPASDVKPVSSSFLTKLLGSTPITQLLMPQNLTSLGSSHLN